MERNLTTGSIQKTIFSFSLPYFLSYFLQTLYGTADLFIIGQFNSVDSTTAVSIGSQVMHMLTVMIVGLAMGTTVMTGRAVGAQAGQSCCRQYSIFVHATVRCPDRNPAMFCKTHCGCHVHPKGSCQQYYQLPGHLFSRHPVYHSL